MIEDAYGDRRTAGVMESTWGHLRPAVGTHPGWVVAARSEYGGERMLIASNFPGLPDSPWLYEALTTLVDEVDMADGSICRFDGALVTDGIHCRFEGGWAQTWNASDKPEEAKP